MLRSIDGKQGKKLVENLVPKCDYMKPLSNVAFENPCFGNF